MTPRHYLPHMVTAALKVDDMGSLRANIWRGTGVLTAIIIAAILVAMFVHLNSSHRVIAQQSPPAILPVDTSAATTITIPALFQTLAISSDGGTIIGFVAAASGTQQPGAIVRYTVATQKSDRVYTFATALQFYADIVSDGRYVAWVTGAQAGDAAPITLALLVMDLQTQHVITIATKTAVSGNPGDYQIAVQHGYVFWQDMAATSTPLSGIIPGALKMANAATGAVTTLSTALTLLTASGSDLMAFHVSWPYVAFTSDGARETPRVIDVTTGSLRVLPSAPVPETGFLHTISYVLGGIILLASWVSSDGSKAFAQLDITNRENSWQGLATITQSLSFHDSFFQANDRLLVLSGQFLTDANEVVTLAWDRHLHQLFRVSTYHITTSANNGDYALGNFTSVDLFSDWLVLANFSANLTTTALTMFPTMLALPH